MENGSRGEDAPKRSYALEDAESTQGITVMLTAISFGLAVVGSIGAWWRFADLVIPIRILISVGALILVFAGTWIFFAFAWFHVWPFPTRHLGNRSKS